MNLNGYYNIEPNLELLNRDNIPNDEESKAPLNINLSQDNFRRAF